jgi:phospholipid transport system substrate-binding protein
MISRRAFLAVSAAAFVSAPALAAGEHPSVRYMRQVGKDLIRAYQKGTVVAFKGAINQHADVASIADYSLGQYGPKLPAGQKQKYYRGVAIFMARYFAEQSRAYPVKKYEVGEARVRSDKDVQVVTKVTLTGGQSYDVSWRLVWRGGRYRIADAKLLGFSLTYLQRNLFTDFIDKRNGDVSKLVVALNS